MPDLDHISANKRLKSEGMIKLLSDQFGSIFSRSSPNGDSATNNIFAPTAALNLFSHINKVMPQHSLILADFDSFLMPRGSIQGITAPMVTHKLRDPTEWTTYGSYLVPRGQADICFPSDFNFLQHAYGKLTSKNAYIYKN